MVRVRYVVCENHVQEGIISEIDNDECLGDNIFQKFLSGMSEYSKLIGEINLDSLMYLPMLFYYWPVKLHGFIFILFGRQE